MNTGVRLQVFRHIHTEYRFLPWNTLFYTLKNVSDEDLLECPPVNMLGDIQMIGLYYLLIHRSAAQKTLGPWNYSSEAATKGGVSAVPNSELRFRFSSSNHHHLSPTRIPRTSRPRPPHSEVLYYTMLRTSSTEVLHTSPLYVVPRRLATNSRTAPAGAPVTTGISASVTTRTLKTMNRSPSAPERAWLRQGIRTGVCIAPFLVAMWPM